jgi:protein-tyrosine phosphatase
MGYVDLHAHFLAGLDDGARDAEGALRMVNALASLGFERLQATPHQRAGMFMPAREAIDAALASLRSAVADAGLEVALGLGAENFWDEVFHERLAARAVPTYDGGRAFLFEVNPQLMPARLAQTLFQIRVSGLLPVMAHPERYHAIQQDVSRAEEIGRTAALLVDLGALDGAHGRAEMKAARRLVEEGLAHSATSDLHSPEDQRPVAGGMAWIRRHLGPARLSQLLDENPRRILAGDLP